MIYSIEALPHLLQLRVAIHGAVAELLLDTNQLVVFRHTVGAAHGAGLDLAGVCGDGDVGDGGVLGLSGAVGGHCGIAVAVGHLDGVECLGE